MRVVSILPPFRGMKLSMKVGPPVLLILDKLTFTNSRLMLSESFLPVTEVDSSSTVPSERKTTPLCIPSATGTFICGGPAPLTDKNKKS